MLKVTDAAMHELEALGGGAATEIGLFDQRYLETPQTRVPGRGRAEGATADDHDVEVLAAELLQRALHQRARARNTKAAT